jgi:hypothetical protein
MTANPSKTPAIKLRRRFTLSTRFRRSTGGTRDACQLIHTRKYGAIAKALQPRIRRGRQNTGNCDFPRRKFSKSKWRKSIL